MTEATRVQTERNLPTPGPTALDSVNRPCEQHRYHARLCGNVGALMEHADIRQNHQAAIELEASVTKGRRPSITR